MLYPPGVAPDYAGGSIVNLTASLASNFGVATGHPPLRPPFSLGDANVVCLVIVDGLGYLQLADLLAYDAMPQLTRLIAGDAALSAITSVFPTTTAAALTSLFTGQTPAEHGRLGYSIFHGHRVVELLSFRDVATGEVMAAASEVSPSESMFGALTASGVSCVYVGPKELEGTALSSWHSRGADSRPYGSLRSLPTRVLRAVKAPPPTFVVAYLPHYDLVAHLYGPASREARHVASLVDRLLDILMEGLPPRAALVVTADHGMRPLDPQRAHTVEDIRFAGERTVRYLSMPAGDRLVTLRDQAEIVPAEEVWQANLFGGQPGHPSYRARVGTHIALPHDGMQLLGYGEEPLRGGHGGVTEAEMVVPLLLAR